MLFYLLIAAASALATAVNETVIPGSIINVSSNELPRFSEFLTEGGQAVWELVASSQDPVAQLKQLSGVYNRGVLTHGNQICPYFQTCPPASLAELSGPAASDASSMVGAAFGAASSAYAHFTQTASPSDVSAVKHALSSYIQTMTDPQSEMSSASSAISNAASTLGPTPAPTPVGIALNSSSPNTTVAGIALAKPLFTQAANSTTAQAFPSITVPINDTKNGSQSLLPGVRSALSSSRASASSTSSSKASSSSSSSSASSSSHPSSSSSHASSSSHPSSSSSSKLPAQSSSAPSTAPNQRASAVVVATNRPVPLQSSNAAERLVVSKLKAVGATVALAGAWLVYL